MDKENSNQIEQNHIKVHIKVYHKHQERGLVSGE